MCVEARGGVYSSGVSKVAQGKRRNKAKVVEELLGKMEKQLTGGGELKASVADYIRLMQLQKELKDEDVSDIEVRWIDREPKSEE